MIRKQNRNSVTSLTGEALFVSGQSACADSTAFSFFDCPPVPQEPQISVLSDVSDLSDSSDKSGYTVITGAVRDFRGWITVTAARFRRAAVRVFRRIFRTVKAVFNRRFFVLRGGLRL